MPQIQSPDQKSTALTVVFERERPALLAMLPDVQGKERWAQFALQALKTPALLRCRPETVVAALHRNAALGLPLDGVHAALIPFGDECTHVVGYPGYVSLYTRHAGVKNVRAQIAFEGDEFDVIEGSDPKIVHKPLPNGDHTDPNKVVAAYAVAHFSGGGTTFKVMWRDELEALAHAQIARAKKRSNKPSPWETSTIEMWRKSPIIRLRKGLNMTEDLQRALAVEERDDSAVEVDAEVVDSRPAPTDLDSLMAANAPTPEPEQGTGFEEPAETEPAMRDLYGIPTDTTIPWEDIRDLKLGGSNKSFSGKTLRALADTLCKKDADSEKLWEAALAVLRKGAAQVAAKQTIAPDFALLARVLERVEMESRF